MIFHRPILRTASVAAAALMFGACGHVEITHVPPGQSLGVAMARKPQLVRLPAPPPGAMPQQDRSPSSGVKEGDNLAHAAEAFSRGQFCMNAGKDDEAISAFEETVKLNPSASEAWQNLAALYEKKGDNKKAIDAFRKAKKIARQ
jgi:tetratricopeptide (TPR) repeat protein